MKQKAYIKATKPGLIVGIIVIIAFLAFGIFFFSLLSGEAEAYIGQTFLIFWIIIVLVIGGVFVNNLINYDKNPESSFAEQIEMPDAFNIREIGTSFDDKLRKIESLRKEGLISEQEFAAKRQEIMEQKW
jgi:H+/Cl- antiporter ClcA